MMGLIVPQTQNASHKKIYIFESLCLPPNFFNMLVIHSCSRVVARRHQEVCEDGELVLCEFLLVVLPVVLVGPLEVLQSLLNNHLQRNMRWKVG